MKELIIWIIITVVIALWAWLIFRKPKNNLYFKSSFQAKMLKKYKK